MSEYKNAIILAAGRGERMRPLTDRQPKPLLEAGGKPLIEWHLEALAAAGVTNIVVNLSWLGDMIVGALGDGSRWGLEIRYSEEGDPALETGGGIFQALPLLGDAPFLVINGDVWLDLDFESMPPVGDKMAHLLMVHNPEHNRSGDFYLSDNQLSENGAGQRMTYSGVGVYSPELFADCSPGRFPLAPLLCDAMARDLVSGQKFDGEWLDVGTVERLELLRDRLRRRDPATQ